MAKVGITILKLNNGYGRGKRKGNLKAIACEALEERNCSDTDYNADNTNENIYEGITSGEELTRVITEEAEAYSVKQKANGGRALRSDAIIGYACIVKPSSDYINNLSDEQRELFWQDSNAVMDNILGNTTISSVIHKDEAAEHQHRFGMPYTKSGKLCGKEFFSLKLYHRFNDEYPRQMRALGWDIDDCTVYDKEQADIDPEYKARHISEKKKKHGLSSAKYKALKDKEKNDELHEEIDYLRKGKDELRQKVSQEQAQSKKLLLENERLLSEKRELEEKLKRFELRETAQNRADRAEQAVSKKIDTTRYTNTIDTFSR